MAPAKNRKAVNSGNKNKTRQPRKLSLEELLQAAELALTTQDPRHAIALYTAALSKAGKSWQQLVEVLEKRAEVHVSLQNQDDALRDYQAALNLVPDPAPPVTPAESSDSASLPNCCSEANVEQLVEILERKAALCMYIGQLSSDADALKSYSTGIDHLTSLLGLQEHARTSDLSNTKQETKRQLAIAYCAVAELYLTDLCFEENAESACESVLNQALGLDDKCPDTLQALCSLRLSQRRGKEAAPIILQVFGTMQVGCSALSSLVGLREDGNNNTGATELLELQEVQDLPGFEFRCQTAKLLLECAAALTEEKEQQGQCAKAAIDVLGSLLAENDEVVEIWILVGDAFAIGEANDEQKELCCHYWERALHMLTEVQKSLAEAQEEADNMEEEDALQEQLDGVICQTEDLRIKIEEAQGDNAMEE